MSKSTQNFVPIKEIRNGILILNDGNMRAIVQASSINFSLKSEDEQMGIITGFQSFLNSLDFKVQFFVQSKKLDIRNYLSLLEKRQELVEGDLMKVQIKEYIKFISTFTEEQNIMTKNFYIIVPYDIPSLTGKTLSLNEVEFMKKKDQLLQRVSIVSSTLSPLGLTLKLLETEEMVSLFYKLYNPNELDSPKVNATVAN